MHLLVGTKVVFCAISLYKLFSSGNYISNVGNIYIYICICIYMYIYILSYFGFTFSCQRITKLKCMQVKIGERPARV
jgi:hypothetical protein